MLIDCITISNSLDAETQEAAETLRNAGVHPRICQVIATANKGVLSYSSTMRKKAQKLGIEHDEFFFEKTDSTSSIMSRVAALNSRPDVHGIIVGVPTFAHVDPEQIINLIDSSKDIDGLGYRNTYFLQTNQEHLGIAPATATAAIHILEKLTGIAGKRIAILGRGRTVGRPVATMLTNRDATVTICHSRTPNIDQIISESDIVVSAVGRPHAFDRGSIRRPNQIIIDCGISIVDGKTVGDFESIAVSEHGVQITPVPGGVGAVTNSIIFANLLKAIRLQTQVD